MKKTLISLMIIFVTLLIPYSLTAKDILTINHSYFEPYVWAEADEISQGIYVDIIKEVIEKNMGIQVRFQNYPWIRAQNNVQFGVDDGFITVPTEKRLLYTNTHKIPIINEYIGVFTTNNNPIIKKLLNAKTVKELKPYRIVSYLGNGWARKNLTEHNVDYTATDFKVALKKLSTGRGDLFVGSKLATLYIMKVMNIKNLKLVCELQGRLPMHLCIGNKSKFRYILKNLDQNINAIEKNGRKSMILKKYR
ncbi:MAG: transporter substrate-binding domain-containing protein [Desulfobacterales bacterium]|nr:transporter substrate-binding domain-containing protein [Desulfobacterales bacterium]